MLLLICRNVSLRWSADQIQRLWSTCTCLLSQEESFYPRRWKARDFAKYFQTNTTKQNSWKQRWQAGRGTLRVSRVGLPISELSLTLAFSLCWYFCPWSWGAQRFLLLCSSYQKSCSWRWPDHGPPPNILPPTPKSYCLQQSVCLNQGSLLIIIYTVFFHDVQIPSLTYENFNIVLRWNHYKISV